MNEDPRNKKLDNWGWWILAAVTGIALFLIADMLGFVEFFWH